MRWNAFTVAMLLMLPLTALAEKTYTPAQLRKMVESGKPPKQGPPSNQKVEMPFSECVAKVTSTSNAVRENYPVHVLVDTAVLFTVKVWTNDAAMLLSCSKPDGAFLATTSKYL